MFRLARVPTRALGTSFPSYVLNAGAYESTKLSNGVRVASEVGDAPCDNLLG